MDNRYNENREHCKHIADEIERITAGHVVKCPHCGELVEMGDDEKGFSCPCCANEIDADDVELYTLYDYFSDAFDIEYRIGSDLQYRSVQIMVACGGPNIYIDTASKNVELYWWGDRAWYPLDLDSVEEIDNIFEEYFTMR